MTAVFSHATGFHGRVWEPMARRLTGVDSHALDLRGHGDTPAPDDYDFPWVSFGQDVLAGVDAMAAASPGTAAPGPPIGIGHSLGGAALLMAEAARPGTFRTLWLFEPATFPAPPPGTAQTNPLVEPTKRRRFAFADRGEALANYAAKSPMNEFDPDVLAAYVEHGFVDDGDRVRLKCLPANEAQMYVSSVIADAYAVLPAVMCPVLVVRGRVGGGPTEWWSRIAETLPDGRLETHDDLGHFGPLTHPERMAASVDRWLADTRA